MLYNMDSLIGEICRYEDTGDGFYSVLLSAHSIAVELEAYKGRRIRMGENATDPSGWDSYILENYYMFKVKDEETKEFSLSLIITVQDYRKCMMSFAYDRIEQICEELVDFMKLKFSIDSNGSQRSFMLCN